MDREIRRLVNQAAARLSRRDFERYQVELATDVRRMQEAGRSLEQLATYLAAAITGAS